MSSAKPSTRAEQTTELDRWHMARALELASRGRGAVEPNPMVGCLITHGSEIIGEGWHRRFGGPHAEIEALWLAGDRARDATAYVTLEPCCHHGKTPPCTDALIAAGVKRVVVALRDPFPKVAGHGIAALRRAGIEVIEGGREDEARWLSAPYLKRLSTGRPWVIAKWAMTLDGKIATRTGDSQWISGEASRKRVHQLRGQVDAILVGSGTARRDDPQLTARPAGLRVATRVIVDSSAQLASDSKLATTAREVPVIVACSTDAPIARQVRLAELGCEVLPLAAADRTGRLIALLDELGRRGMTNVLCEGGSQLLGSMFDAGLVDDAHIFIAPLLIGGAAAPSPIAGLGLEQIGAAWQLVRSRQERLGDDLYLSGRIERRS